MPEFIDIPITNKICGPASSVVGSIKLTREKHDEILRIGKTTGSDPILHIVYRAGTADLPEQIINTSIDWPASTPTPT